MVFPGVGGGGRVRGGGVAQVGEYYVNHNLWQTFLPEELDEALATSARGRCNRK